MAPYSYALIYDAAGNRKAVLTAEGADGGDNGFLYLTWKKNVNGVDLAELMINANNPDAAHIVDKYILQIWRADPAVGLAEYKSFEGELRDDIRFTDEQNRHRIRARAYGPNSRLARRNVLYPANTANRTVFSATPAETVLKTLVEYNAGASATTANGRDRTANTLGITNQTNAATGNVIDWNCGGRPNLLTELQKIAKIAGGDFALVQTGFGAYQFRFYLGQLGTDRTSGANAVIFSLDRGNMANPTLARMRSEEKTVAIVGGQGEESNRVIRVRTGANYSATNDIETFIDGRNGQTNAYLDETGDFALEDAEFRNALEYDVLQTPIYTVEQDYFLGDKVLAQYSGVSMTQKVQEIVFEYSEYREAASVVMRDI